MNENEKEILDVEKQAAYSEEKQLFPCYIPTGVMFVFVLRMAWTLEGDSRSPTQTAGWLNWVQGPAARESGRIGYPLGLPRPFLATRFITGKIQQAWKIAA